MSIVRDTQGARPLTARSVIASNLLGVHPPRLPVAALVAAGELFGLTAGATRTALSRMVRAGEVSVEDRWYALEGALLERANRQADARVGAVRPWDGTWVLAVVVGDARSAGDRAALRVAMGRLAMAAIREGVWARPDNLDPERGPRERQVADAQCSWVRHASVDQSVFLAAFDHPTWARDATQFADRLDRAAPGLEAGDTTDLGDRFVLAADALRHLVRDPRLPEALTPSDWPAVRFRASYERYDAAFKTVMAAWTRTWRNNLAATSTEREPRS